MTPQIITDFFEHTHHRCTLVNWELTDGSVYFLFDNNKHERKNERDNYPIVDVLQFIYEKALARP